MHRLKATGIAVKAAVKDIYGLRDGKKPSEEMQKAKENHPKLTKWAFKASKFIYRLGLVGVGLLLRDTIGSALAYTIALCHPFFVSSFEKFRHFRKEHPMPKEEHAEKEKSGLLKRIKHELKSLRALIRPDMTTRLLTFSALEFASYPASVWVNEKIAELSGKVVTPAFAALGLLAGTLAMYAIEYIGFYALWKKYVLRGVEPGTAKDALKGFVKELHPMRLFKSRANAVPENASDYIGQTIGVGQSYYLILHLYRFPLAMSIACIGLDAHAFMDALVASLTGAYMLADCLIWPRWADGVTKKMREDNEHLRLGPP